MIATILIFLAVLVVLVVVHEAGHALTARAVGCRVEEFGIGFPPRLWKRQIGETVFSLNLVPLGGFVRITGEDGHHRGDPRSFASKRALPRLAVLVAGVVMNLVLAVVLFGTIAGIGVSVPVSEDTTSSLPLSDHRTEIVEVGSSDILRTAGVQLGDVLLAVDGERIGSSQEAAERIRGFTGSLLSLIVRRDGREELLSLAFPGTHVAGEPIGIGLVDIATYRVAWWRTPWEGIRATARTVDVTFRALGTLLRNLVVERVVPADVSGPLGIAAIVGTVSQRGILPLLELTAVLSVNLALMNILPIPALDGGRVLFVLLESVGIRRLSGHPERLAHAVGFTLLMILMLLITFRDLQRLLH